MVTQKVAADAQESASVSEELFARAEEMNGYVSKLAALVGERTILDLAPGKSRPRIGTRWFRAGAADAIRCVARTPA